jgi:hypothetical protein
VKPFLRRRDRGQLAPVGWTSEPAGNWDGHPVDVVYDPARHQILLARNQLPQHLHDGLTEAGYRPFATAGPQTAWVRDHSTATRNALTTHDTTRLSTGQGSALVDPTSDRTQALEERLRHATAVGIGAR